MNPLLAGTSNLLRPLVARAYTKGRRQLVLLVIGTTVAVGAMWTVFCMLIAVFGEQILHIMYDGKYEGNGPVVFLLGRHAGARGQHCAYLRHHGGPTHGSR